ncbi:hypothetical protein CEP51_000476 [Fusarium floridanum]|uniref:Uncharacterized protein n=1 Tax=Fusarium floridanum TaxID=1325733 RepID=A0A428SMI0_9HYPO|nr:hypothetical protein CEP51_000476 [Fusarium floridanum]
MKQVLVEGLDRASARSLLLWRASTGEQELSQEDHDSVRQAARVFDGFPLGLELAGILIHEEILPLKSFEQDFIKNYKRLSQFQVDPVTWLWNTSDSLFGMFDALYRSLIAKNPQSGYLLNLCSIFGPWNIPVSLIHGLDFHTPQGTLAGSDSWGQLQAFIENEVELNLAIHEIERLFLAKKNRGSNGTLVSISLHASLCQWRLANLGEESSTWIMQASYGLVRYIHSQNARKGKATQSSGNVDIAYRFSHLIDGCLSAIAKHVDESDLQPPSGRFASHFFTVSSCAADLYLSLGKLQTAKKLFKAAIDHIRATQIEETIAPELVELLRGFASCCVKIGDLGSAQEALKSALATAELVFGQVSDEAVEIASQLKAISDSVTTELEHRKRALVASTGGKRAPAETDPSDSHTTVWVALPQVPKRTVDTVPTVPQTEEVKNRRMKCQLWFSKPVAIFGNGSVPVIEGGIHVRLLRETRIVSVIATLRCISTMTSDDGDNETSILWSIEKHLRLRKAVDLDPNTERGTTDWATGVRSLISTTQDLLLNSENLPQGSYCCPFEFDCGRYQVGTARLTYRSITWEVGIRLQGGRGVIRPVLKWWQEVFVVQDEERLSSTHDEIPFDGQWEGDLCELAGFGGAIPLGSVVPVKVNLATCDVDLKRYAIRCVLVQTENDLGGSDPHPEYWRRISLSTDHQWKELGDSVWVPIQTESPPEPVVFGFQLPTCWQMLKASNHQLNSSGVIFSTEIRHCLEITIASSDAVNAFSNRQYKLSKPVKIPVTLVDCRVNDRIDPPINMSDEDLTGENVVLLSSCGCYDSEISRVQLHVPQPGG